MESTVLFHEAQDVGPDDFNNLQGFARRSLDHVVADGLAGGGARYAGFTTVKSGPTSVTVAAGRLYSGGAVYLRDSEYVRDFVTSLPVAGKKFACLVTWGESIETDLRPREFLINEETGATEPRVVAMEKARIAKLNIVLGEEAPDPSLPLIDVALTEIARVLLTPTGVESVIMVEANQLENLDKVGDRVDGLDKFAAEARPQLSTLATNIAKLAGQVAGTANMPLLMRIAADVARLKDKAGIPDVRIDYASDHFLDTSESDTANPVFLAKVEEGIRFGAEAMDERQLQVFDPLNPRQKVIGGLLLPAYDPKLRLSVGPVDGELSIAQYQYQTHEMRQLTRSRQRTRYGEEYTVCTNSAWWQSGQYDPVAGTFKRDGEVFEAHWDVNAGWGFNDINGGHWPMRLRRVWVDTVEEPYWDRVTISHTVQGAQVSNTFLNAQDGWLVQLGLPFTRLGADGAVHVAITETIRGEPDPERVIGVATVNRADLRIAGDKTIIPLLPVYLQAGRRYSFTVTTVGDHWLGTTTGANYAQGTLFYSTDGAYHQGDLTKDIAFDLWFAEFKTSRVVVDMQPLSLSGGIAAIDILAETTAPKSTGLVYEVQVGGVWHPLEAVTASALVGLPPLLPLRVVFVGTSDMMPAVALSGSRVRVSRPRTTFVHISKARTLPANASNIRVQVRYEYLDPAFHTAGVKLLTGAGFATEVSPSATTETAYPEESAIERVYTFALGAPANTFKIKTTGGTSTALKTFHVAERVDIALS